MGWSEPAKGGDKTPPTPVKPTNKKGLGWFPTFLAMHGLVVNVGYIYVIFKIFIPALLQFNLLFQIAMGIWFLASGVAAILMIIAALSILLLPKNFEFKVNK